MQALVKACEEINQAMDLGQEPAKKLYERWSFILKRNLQSVLANGLVYIMKQDVVAPQVNIWVGGALKEGLTWFAEKVMEFWRSSNPETEPAPENAAENEREEPEQPKKKSERKRPKEEEAQESRTGGKPKPKGNKPKDKPAAANDNAANDNTYGPQPCRDDTCNAGGYGEGETEGRTTNDNVDAESKPQTEPFWIPVSKFFKKLFNSGDNKKEADIRRLQELVEKLNSPNEPPQTGDYHSSTGQENANPQDLREVRFHFHSLSKTGHVMVEFVGETVKNEKDEEQKAIFGQNPKIPMVAWKGEVRLEADLYKEASEAQKVISKSIFVNQEKFKNMYDFAKKRMEDPDFYVAHFGHDCVKFAYNVYKLSGHYGDWVDLYTVAELRYLGTAAAASARLRYGAGDEDFRVHARSAEEAAAQSNVPLDRIKKVISPAAFTQGEPFFAYDILSKLKKHSAGDANFNPRSGNLWGLPQRWIALY
jgi:hypothetical protein